MLIKAGLKKQQTKTPVNLDYPENLRAIIRLLVTGIRQLKTTN